MLVKREDFARELPQTSDIEHFEVLHDHTSFATKFDFLSSSFTNCSQFMRWQKAWREKQSKICIPPDCYNYEWVS